MNFQVLSNTLKDKNILVTGGTGSFGHQIIRELFKYEPASINVYSRDEKKQYDEPIDLDFFDGRLLSVVTKNIPVNDILLVDWKMNWNVLDNWHSSN